MSCRRTTVTETVRREILFAFRLYAESITRTRHRLPRLTAYAFRAKHGILREGSAPAAAPDSVYFRTNAESVAAVTVNAHALFRKCCRKDFRHGSEPFSCLCSPPCRSSRLHKAYRCARNLCPHIDRHQPDHIGRHETSCSVESSISSAHTVRHGTKAIPKKFPPV